VRVPFLDKELMQAVFSISADVKYHKSIPKNLLIAAFSSILPKEIWQRKRQGFAFPFYSWLRKVEVATPDLTMQTKRIEFLDGQLHWSRYWASVLEQQKPIIYG
jgi:asparagine synthase (glutamine-hydrolysing)